MGKGSGSGAALGTIVGALLALPTGGVSVGVGAAIGAGIGAGAGAAAIDAPAQEKAMKKAAAQAEEQQNRLIKQAEDKSIQDDATTSSAIARARQKALAASVSAQGRSSTIATGSQGVTGQAPGTVKQLIGE